MNKVMMLTRVSVTPLQTCKGRNQTERYIVKTKIYTVENIGYFYYNIEATSEQEAIDKLQGSTLDHDQFEMDSLPTVVEVQS